MRKAFVAILILIALLVIVAPASAWLTGYQDRVTITVTSAGALNDYQERFKIFRSSGTNAYPDIYVGSSGCLANFSDINFTDSSDNQVPQFTTDTDNATYTVIWANLKNISAGTTTYYMYYGNSGATYRSNGNTTFPTFFDGFDGAAVNTSLWDTSGTVAEGSNKVTLGATSTYGTITSKQSFSPPFRWFTSAEMPYNTWGYGTTANNPKVGLNTTYFGYGSDGNSYFYATSDSSNLGGKYVGSWEIQVPTPSSGVKYKYREYNYSDDPGALTSSATDAESGPFSIYMRSNYMGQPYMMIQTVSWLTMIGNYTNNEPSLSLSAGAPPTTAAFSANVTAIAPGGTVAFTDSSTGSPDHWWWTFGDTNTATTQNPTHSYSSAGTYTVTLVAQQAGINSTETKTNYISVGQPPTAGFSPNKTVATAGSTILFTDTSGGATWYNWTFGEGGANVTTASPTHQYMSSGTYTVIQTVSNAYGSSSTSASIVISSVVNATGYGQYYASKTTTFHIQSTFGAPLTGATVTMTGIQTSSGSWDWLAQLLGVKFNETPVNTYTMSTVTDSNGEAQFLVLPSVVYNVSIYESGTLIKTFTVTPTDDRYVVMTDWSIFGPTGKDVNAVDSFNLTKTINSATSVTLTLNGTDTAGHLTGGTAIVNQSTNGTETTIYSTALPAGNFSINIPLTNYAGNSYLVHVAATQSDYGTVYHDFGVTFPKAKSSPLNLDDKSLFMVSMVILFAVGGIFTATTKDKGALITCFAGWILYSMGWLDYMGSNVPIWLTFATVISIAFIVAIGKVRGQ